MAAPAEDGRFRLLQSPRAPEGEQRSGLNFSIYYPEKIITNDDLTRNGALKSGSGVVLTSDDVLKKIGVEQRREAGPREHTLYMAEAAARSILQQMGNELGAIFVTTSYPVGVHLSSALAANLGQAIDPSRRHDVHAACSGGPLALTYMLDNEQRFRGLPFLLVSSERYQETLPHAAEGHTDHSLSETIFSDGAVAMGGVFGTDIRPLAYANYYPSDSWRHDVENMALCMPVEPELNREPDPKLFVPIPHPRDFNEYAIPPDKFFMQGKFVYAFMRDLVPRLIADVTKQLGSIEVAKIIPHQASLPMVNGIRGRLPDDLKGKVYINMREGNWSSGSTIRGLGAIIKSGEIKSGDVVILVGYGAGLCASAVAVEIG